MAVRQDASTGKMVEVPETDAEKLVGAADSGKKATLAVKVYAPFEVYFEGEALSVTAVNETGPFDVLPKHHNFLCMLVPCDLVIKTPFEDAPKKIRISRALMYVKEGSVRVFVDV